MVEHSGGDFAEIEDALKRFATLQVHWGCGPSAAALLPALFPTIDQQKPDARPFVLGDGVQGTMTDLANTAADINLRLEETKVSAGCAAF